MVAASAVSSHAKPTPSGANGHFRGAWVILLLLLTHGRVSLALPANDAQPGGAPPYDSVTSPSTAKAEPAAEPPLLTLGEAQQSLEIRNPEIEIARQQLARSHAASRRAWSLILPFLNASAARFRNNQSIALTLGLPAEVGAQLAPLGIRLPAPERITIQRLYQSNAHLGLRWPLGNGRAVALIKAAYDEVSQAELSVSETRAVQRYISAVIYYGILSAERLVNVRERAVANTRRHLTLEKARLAIGTSTEVAAMRAEVDVATQEQALVQARNSLVLNKHALAVLIGRIRKDGTFADFRVVRPPPANVAQTAAASSSLPAAGFLLQLALAQRPDLKRNYLDVTISRRRKDDTWLRFLPVISLLGDYFWSDVTGFSGRDVAWQAGIGLSWNIIEGGQRYFELQENQHTIAIAQAGVSRTLRNITQEVTQARLDLDSALASLEAAQRRADLASRTLAVVEAQYDVGAATQLDLLDVSRASADAEASLAIAELAVDLSQLTVSHVIIAPLPASATASGGGAAVNGSPDASVNDDLGEQAPSDIRPMSPLPGVEPTDEPTMQPGGLLPGVP